MAANTKDLEDWDLAEILTEEIDINAASKACKRYLRRHLQG
jgi:hypothetical protein